MEVETFGDFVRRRRLTCTRCHRVRNCDQRECECVTNEPSKFVTPSLAELQHEYSRMVQAYDEET